MKFTKGNIKTNPQKLVPIQRAHLNRALADPDYDQAALRRIVVPPTAGLLSEVTQLLREGKDAQLQSPHNPRHTISTADFCAPVPQVADADPAAVGDYILRVFRAVEDLPHGPAGFVYEHPSFFLRPSPRAYAQHTSGASPIKLKDTDAEPLALLRDLRAALEVVPEAEWTPDRLQAAVDGFCTANATVVRDESGEVKEVRKIGKATYQLLRLVLTGQPDRGARPAKLQLALLGRDETLLRFKVCGV